MNDTPDDSTNSEGSSSFQSDNIFVESISGLESLISPLAQRYEVREKVGRGGQGQVFVCEDKTLGRIVALKEPNQVSGWSRLQREALIAAKLSHPNIVPVYDISSKDGVPCSIMKLIGKETLADAIKEFHSSRPKQSSQATADSPEEYSLEKNKSRSLADMIGILKDTCNAIAYAHSKEILHRDLKPQNISLGDYGETMVIDWGLACSIHDIQSSGQSHCSGTEKYSPPEQVQGDSSKIGYTSDIFSLGAILFEILTNTTVGDARVKLEHQGLTTDAAVSPRMLQPKISPDLDAICRKALQPDPKQRYAQVVDFISDLSKYQQDLPVSARKESWQDWLRRFSKAHYASLLSTATAAVITAIAASALIAVTLYKNNQISLAQQDLLTALTVTDDTIRSLEKQDVSYYALADITSGRVVRSTGDQLAAALPLYKGILKLRDRKSDEALPLLEESHRKDPDRDLALFFLSLNQANLINFADSIRNGKILAERSPKNPYAQQHMADILLQSIDDNTDSQTRLEILRDAEKYSRLAHELDPDFSLASMTLGDVLYELGQTDDAEQFMKKGIAADPTPDNKRMLRNLLRGQSRLAEALSISFEIISQPPVDPNDSSTNSLYRGDLLAHARILRELGQLEEAIKYFRQFDDLQSAAVNNKDPITAHYNDWGLALSGQRKFAEALVILEKGKQEFQGNPIFEVSLATALLGSGDRAAAVTKLNQAFQSDKSPYLLCHLLQGLIVSGEFAEARQIESSLPPFDSNTPAHFIVLRAGLAQLASQRTNADPSPAAAAWPKLAESPAIQNETWDYYYLEKWCQSLPESEQAQARTILDKLSSIIAPRYPIN